MKLLARWPWFVGAMRRKDGAGGAPLHPRPSGAGTHAPGSGIGALLNALVLSTLDRMTLRLPGTENDIAVTRSTEYPLEQISVPVLVVHGTADRMVPFARHGKPHEVNRQVLPWTVSGKIRVAWPRLRVDHLT